MILDFFDAKNVNIESTQQKDPKLNCSIDIPIVAD